MRHKSIKSPAIGLVLISFLALGLAGQQTGTLFVNQLRLDLRLLGHPPLDVIPPGESAITSLVIGADGNLYGGTSGKRAHLFSLDPRWGHVFPLGHLEGEESIFHSLAAAPDGAIFIGTSLFNRGQIAERGRDVLARYEDYAGGHIYRFDPAVERNNRKRMQNPDPQRPLPFAADLGIPVKGEGITCLVQGEGTLYGITFPGGHFFVMDIAAGKAKDLGPICGPPLHEEPFRSIPRALVIDTEGRVWGAGDYGELFHYDPGKDKVIHHRDRRLPSELGREFKAVLDALIQGPDGKLYGGTSDGFLFRFCPESLRITNLGKPMWQYRIRGLAFSRSGDLYGVGGDRGGAARLFVYRSDGRAFENLGMLDVNRSPYYAWHAFEADAMVSGPDGTIFIGEAGRISHLYLLYPW
jgi:hypothetical protein